MSQKSEVNSTPIKIRTLTTSDLPRIIHLLQGFQYPFGEDHYKWKYLECPWGSLTIIAEAGEEIVGHFGHVFRPFWIHDQQILFSMKADLLIRNDYQGKGIFTKLSHASLQALAKKDVHFTYGFPNEMSLLIDHAHGARSIGYLPLYVKILQMESVFEKLGKHCFLKPFSKGLSLFFRSHAADYFESLEVKEVTNFPDSVDLLWNSVLTNSRRSYQNIGLRTNKFLKWRFLSCPDREYQLVIINDLQGVLRGYAILRVVEVLGLKEGVIVDIFHAPFDREGCMALLSHTHEFFNKSDVDLIVCLLTDSYTCLPETLRRCGFRRFTKRFNPRPQAATMQNTTLKVIVPGILNQQQWYLTLADSDFF